MLQCYFTDLLGCITSSLICSNWHAGCAGKYEPCAITEACGQTCCPGTACEPRVPSLADSLPATGGYGEADFSGLEGPSSDTCGNINGYVHICVPLQGTTLSVQPDFYVHVHCTTRGLLLDCMMTLPMLSQCYKDVQLLMRFFSVQV